MPTQKTIAVNTRFLLKNLEGIGRFTCESLQRITQQHPEHDFVFLFDRPYDKKYIFGKNVKGVVVQPPARHPFLWYAWFEWGVPAVLKKIKPDVFVSTDGYASLSTDIPTVLVIHDIAFEHYPEQVPFLVRKYYRHFTPRFAQKAARIATVSSYTKQDVVEQYGVAANKIDVVYNGANDIYKPLSASEKTAFQQEYAKGCEYFLFVGAIHPRKNLHNILRAFEGFKKATGSDMKLVVAGRKAWQSGEAYEVYNNIEFKEEVLFLGHLQLATLAKVYGAAKALVYPSIFEGFGIPIIEAFSCEIPVITSTTSSMPEVAGDAAILVNPMEVGEIQAAMQTIYASPDTCRTLISKGTLQKQKFSWQQTADRFWGCIEQVL